MAASRSSSAGTRCKYGADSAGWAPIRRTLGASGGNFGFTAEWTQQDPFVARSNQGNSFASFLLGYPTTGSVPITTPVNVFTDYSAGIHSGRSSRELAADGEFRTAIRVRNRACRRRKIDSPSRSIAMRSAPLPRRPAGPRRRFPICGARTDSRAIKAIHRRRSSRLASAFVYSEHRTRWSAADMGCSGRRGCTRDRARPNWGQIGYTQTTFIDTSNSLIPTTTLGRSVPKRFVATDREQLRPRDRNRRQRHVRRSEPAIPLRAAVLRGCPATAAGKHGRGIRVCRRARR